MEPDYRDLIPEGLYEILSNTSLKIKIYNNKLWISDLVKNIENLPEIISIKLEPVSSGYIEVISPEEEDVNILLLDFSPVGYTCPLPLFPPT